MKISRFSVIGENIHCTRILKRSGGSVECAGDGGGAIVYGSGSGRKLLRIPEPFLKCADWENGKVKRCAVAIWQGMNGRDEDRTAGIDYIQTMAREQEVAGAAFIDVNVDEFSVDLGERIEAMRWTVALLRDATSLPLAIDTANEDVMREGLRESSRSGRGSLVNSVSLERPAMLKLAAEHEAAVVASAAGEDALPVTVDERLSNVGCVTGKLEKLGIGLSRIYVDPLVYTISTDPGNGTRFLESVAALRREYGPDIHVIGGLSNISFGMPSRKLINLVFARLSVESGGDGGIVDPLQINISALQALDPGSEPFKLARALLMGEDQFGMEFITAHREGRLS